MSVRKLDQYKVSQLIDDHRIQCKSVSCQKFVFRSKKLATLPPALRVRVTVNSQQNVLLDQIH